MNVQTLDLNLLRVFDAVYAAGSISKAALKLHLSQPAVSNALGRLRRHLDDNLFVRKAQGMTPTPRAHVLIEPVRRALAILDQGLRAESPFDFPHSDRRFVIAAEDYGEAVLMPRFIDWLASSAPSIRIVIRYGRSGSLAQELRDGAVDLALDFFALPLKGYQSQCLLTDSLRTLARQNNREIGLHLDLNTFTRLRHVVLAPPHQQVAPMIDLALRKRNLRRTIAVTVPHFMSMPAIVSASDLVCTMPDRMASLYVSPFQLKAYQTPLRIPNFPVYMIWHDSLEGDEGHRWLRDNLMELAHRL